MSAALSLERLRLRRPGGFVLEIDRLEIAAGRLSWLVGPNGAGKTSLLLAAAGLLDIERGQVSLSGQPFHRGRAPAPRAARRRIGLVFQEPYLFSGSAARNVGLPLRLRGIGRAERRRRTAEALERVGLAGFEDRPAERLSGGQRKLVALARAFVARPEVLLCDEVFAGLDAGAAARVEALLAGLAGEQGVAVLAATHGIDRSLQDGLERIELLSGRLVEDPGAGSRPA